MVLISCIKLKPLQLSSNFTRASQSSLVNKLDNNHKNHRFSKNGLLRKLINNPFHLHSVVAATNRKFGPTPTTVKSMKPHRLALSIMTKFRKVSCVAMLVMCMVLRVERVPFSNRRHLTFRSLPQRFLISRSRMKAYTIVEEIKQDYQGTRVLPSTHEKSLRVATIASKLGQGMHDTLGLKREFTIVAYELCNTSNPVWTVGRRSGQALRKSSCDTFNSRTSWFKRRYSTKHLEGAEWKITVIDSPVYNAYLHSDKHIFVLTKLIDNCSDEELAGVIGHEMGHAIARHKMDTVIAHYSRYIFEVALFNKIMSFVYQHFLTSNNKIKLEKIGKDYSRRRQELEADYIGMMLMASAGYHPRAAIIGLYKAGYVDSDDDMSYSDDDYPSGRDRVEYLKNPERMKKAMCLFRDYQLRLNNNLTHF
ncbi:mitochondrial metalloendopeptidase OMA1-like [Silene latifolia]|uniref:mitochondrial metalloendopeptidase OMA1-like n=1 Tax=Silene latifolia TaxID=37657 RepID=UPI003D78A97C